MWHCSHGVFAMQKCDSLEALGHAPGARCCSPPPNMIPDHPPLTPGPPQALCVASPQTSSLPATKNVKRENYRNGSSSGCQTCKKKCMRRTWQSSMVTK